MARRTVAELCRDAAWSQWAAIGVSSNRARQPRYAVDVEAAIAFAPALNELEPRLFEEVVDWCSRFAGGFVSLTRLKQVLDLFASRHRPVFDRFAAVINRVGQTKWPTTLGPQPPVRLTGKSRLALATPAAVQLRARKAFGISARSDVIVALLLSPRGWTRISVLANLGYTKRALSDALGDLYAGGVVDKLEVGNSLRYKLAKPKSLAQLLAPLPRTHWAPWPQRFAIAERLLDVERRIEGKSPTVRAVEAHKALAGMAELLGTIEEAGPTSTRGGGGGGGGGGRGRGVTTDPWDDVVAWAAPMLSP